MNWKAISLSISNNASTHVAHYSMVLDSMFKRVNLTVAQKLELIKSLESGASVKCVYEEYGVKKKRKQFHIFLKQNLNLLNMLSSIQLMDILASLVW